MKIFKRVFLGLLIVSVVLTLGFALWANDAALQADVALQALKSNEQVTVTQHDGFITFEPVEGKPTIGFVLYPGGRVDYRAYAPLLREIAARGYFVAVVRAPINMAIFDVNAADKVITEYPAIEQWIVGGHSLGGVAAASFATENQNRLRGLVYWTSYPNNDLLKNSDIKILSIYGTKDMAGMEPFERSRSLLPADTQYVVIDGGNHAQFGAYGFQAGDNPADISQEEQWRQIVDATSRFLESFRNE